MKERYEACGVYERWLKRPIDIICTLVAIIMFCWLYGLVAILVYIKLGRPIIFTQERPGKINLKTGKEQIFKLYKFRTMTDERDENGNLLPDNKRLTKFGKYLRASSLDELPEVWNILKGDMSVVGPRPQLVKDMVFMTPEQRVRHTVRPGLSGLAQVMGRNAILWEDKFAFDLKYIRNVTFLVDTKIVFLTIWKAFIKHEGITEEHMATAEDYGDFLLRIGAVSEKNYDELQCEAKRVLKENKGKRVISWR